VSGETSSPKSLFCFCGRFHHVFQFRLCFSKILTKSPLQVVNKCIHNEVRKICELRCYFSKEMLTGKCSRAEQLKQKCEPRHSSRIFIGGETGFTSFRKQRYGFSNTAQLCFSQVFMRRNSTFQYSVYLGLKPAATRTCFQLLLISLVVFPFPFSFFLHFLA